jgi:hypothetical protein
MERRKSTRYRVIAPVLFSWDPKNRPPQSGKGVTRDISTSGVYVLTAANPPVGSRVQMEILVPKLRSTDVGIHLCGEGIVVRVESGGITREDGFVAKVHFSR